MNKEFLFEMLRTGSVSGNEIELQKKVIKYMSDTSDKVMTDATGNVTNVLNPESEIKLMLSGHIDEIGLIVTYFNENGTIKVAKAGGIRTSMYLGHKVRIYTKTGIIYGTVVANSALLSNKDIKPSDLTIDIGAFTKEEATAVVSLGDSVTIDEDVRPLLNNCITARAMDDRTGAFIVIEALRRAKEKGCQIGLYSTTSVGEETTLRGAYWAASRIKPNFAIAVDVTYATDYEGCDVYETGIVKVGSGPVICNSSLCNKKMNQLMKDIASDLNIPLQIEAATGRTGTDADQIHFTNEGVPTMLLSLPLRYMHSHGEMGSLTDIQNCIELLAEFACRITKDTTFNPFE